MKFKNPLTLDFAYPVFAILMVYSQMPRTSCLH